MAALSRVDLEGMVGAGEVDTVLCVMPDLWGRVVGKRVPARNFLERILGPDGLHASLYLFVVDLDMNPLPGFELTDWERGFQDFRMVPDLSTLRLVPWLEGTALVICDAVHEKSGLPVEVSPRQILRRQVERARAAGYTVKCGSELEVFLFRDSYEEAFGRSYRELRPLSHYRADYHILQTTKVEWLIRQIRNGMNDAGVPVEFSKGEWGLGQHEINLCYTDAMEMADRHAIYKNGLKEIAALNGLSATFMAKWSAEEVGSSFHIHSSLWNEDGTESLMWDQADPRHMSQTFRHYLAGLMATARELTLLKAPTMNAYRRYERGSFAPTAIAWGDDNRTCGFRVVGEHEALRVEDRIPGADANPYLAFAATIAGGLHGLEHKIEPPAVCTGNAYEAREAEQIPSSMAEAVAAFEGSSVAREALGEEVFDHLLCLARAEKLAFEAAAVEGEGAAGEWELIRYFERI
ncbi:MAG TPA: glutamine synthetase family protein [Actinomycetes bacterium]|jgi:glutamine synthetase|nr:glutamine synthetase family protein [Actinomycetes bacterium]